MGWMSVMGSCFACGRVFLFNADHVPSIVDPKTGHREPICGDCVKRANPIRIANGLPPIAVHPQAYEPQEVA